MPAASITINGTTGSDLDLPINTLVNLNNNNVGDETTWAWTILDQPSGSTATLTGAATTAATFTPDVEGTYLIRLVVDASLPGEATDQVVATVRQLKSHARIPAAGETTEADASRGWAGAYNNDLLRGFDDLAHKAVVFTGEAGGAMAIGDVVSIQSTATIKAGLPGEEVVPQVEVALATDQGVVEDHALGIVLRRADEGAGAIGGGDLVVVLRRGLSGPAPGSPSPGDPVYVDDAGAVSLTQGTYARFIGRVVSASGGFYYFDFTGDSVVNQGNNLAAVSAPTVTDDDASGYAVGSTWIDTSAPAVYFCTDASTGAAVWVAASSVLGGFATSVLLISGSTVTPYATITLALAASASGDTVLVGQGTYTENLSIPAGVTVIGALGDWSRVTLVGVGGAPAVTMANSTGLRYVQVAGPNDANPTVYTNAASGPAGPTIDTCRILAGGGSNTHGFEHAGTALCVILRTSFADALGAFAGNAIHVSGGGTLVLREIFFAGTAVAAMYVDNGTIEGSQVRAFPAGAAYTYGVHVNGASAIIDCHNCHMGDGLQTGLHFGASSDGCYVQVTDGELRGSVADVSNDPSATGAGTQFYFTAMSITEERTTLDATWRGNAEFAGLIFDQGVQNDPAHRVLGELAVGALGSGAEFSAGEGASTVSGMRVFSFDGTATWIDNTAAAKSGTGSTFSLWQSTAAGEIAYIGNEAYPFADIENDVAAAIALGSGEIAWEYWNGSGASWDPVNICVVSADHPAGTFTHPQYAQDSFGRIESSHIHLGQTEDWATTTVNGQSAYWVRCRIVTGITTVPTIERFRLGGSYLAVNPDGFANRFGLAQSGIPLLWHANLTDDLNGAAPGNVTVAFTTNISSDLTGKLFHNNALDGVNGRIRIGEGLNTAWPLILTVLFKAEANGAPSDVELECRFGKYGVGSTLDGSIADSLQSNIITIGAADADVVKATTFVIPIEDFVPGDRLVISVFRDATGGNPDDTLAADIAFIDSDLVGLFWGR